MSSILQCVTVEPPNNGQVGDERLSFIWRLSLCQRFHHQLHTLKLLSHFNNDIAYTLDVNSMS